MRGTLVPIAVLLTGCSATAKAPTPPTTLAPSALHTHQLKRQPLHSLPAGTEFKLLGQVQARLTTPGFARASAQQDGLQYVVAAVDDDVVVEGWINPRQLGPELAAGAP